MSDVLGQSREIKNIWSGFQQARVLITANNYRVFFRLQCRLPWRERVKLAARGSGHRNTYALFTINPTARKAIKPGEKRLKSANLGTDFIQCVKTRATTVGPIDDAVYSDIMSHIADIAIRLKRPVKWDPAKEVIVGDAEASKLLSRPIRSPWSI